MTGSLPIDRIVGVYDADGGVVGEIRYVVGRLGGRHCALCEITHGTLRPKPAWGAWATTIPVPVVLVHLNQREPALRQATDGRVPCVVADVAGKYQILLDDEALRLCEGSVATFSDRLDDAIALAGLQLP
ncbi:MAG: hypothetical protein M3R71_03010 [Actinomycetota bacterium]|nr:hypothetical protein [Actinomycetota bacterium]